MKRINIFSLMALCFLLPGISSCDHETTPEEAVIPQAVLDDFSNRYSSAQIVKYQNYPEGLSRIDFTDRQQNQASAWYTDEFWKMTQTQINDLYQLPAKARETFLQTEYENASIQDITRTERAGIAGSLYILHFQYHWHETDNVEHNILINDDGKLLSTFTSCLNDPCWTVNLSADHFDFIARTYKGAEIRGYVNNAGSHEYFILHQDTMKEVYFRGEIAAEFSFWTKTQYELDPATRIPDNVLRRLKQEDPDFIYTHLYYIESENGNSYLFQDKKRENELGYIIREDTK